jgi:phosphoribosylaminoimidazole-succinocarboxamide synthase
MVKNQKLSENILTPTTKGEVDEPITPEDIVSKKYMSQEEWDYISSVSLELFKFGQTEAQKKGLILVDTKYEFGKDKNGKVYLIDELHTPDSSRYWILDSYEKRFMNKEEPENVDKEFLRLWFSKNCDPYNDETLPEAPIELVHELSRRYIYLYQTITGKTFLPTIPEYVIQPWGEGVIQSRTEQIEKSIQKYLEEYK